ncbi:MAG: hypothetical protein WAW16_05435 [Candidatus Cryosericum sp.]
MKEPKERTDATAVGGFAGFIIIRARPKWNEKSVAAPSGLVGGDGSSPSFRC